MASKSSPSPPNNVVVVVKKKMIMRKTKPKNHFDAAAGFTKEALAHRFRCQEGGDFYLPVPCLG